MSELWNSNRMRVSVRTFKREYSERFEWFHFNTWDSYDHGKQRPEWTLCLVLAGIVTIFKWRPNGKGVA